MRRHLQACPTLQYVVIHWFRQHSNNNKNDNTQKSIILNNKIQKAHRNNFGKTTFQLCSRDRNARTTKVLWRQVQLNIVTPSSDLNKQQKCYNFQHTKQQQLQTCSSPASPDKRCHASPGCNFFRSMTTVPRSFLRNCLSSFRMQVSVSVVSFDNVCVFFLVFKIVSTQNTKHINININAFSTSQQI
jgi:hypothetical protein